MVDSAEGYWRWFIPMNDWEPVTEDTRRLRVPGGWMVSNSAGLAFYPDPGHVWKIETEEKRSRYHPPYASDFKGALAPPEPVEGNAPPRYE